jgi:surface antigen
MMKTHATICGAFGLSLALACCTTSSGSSDSGKTAGIGCGGAIAGEILLGNMSSLVAAACAGGVAMASLLDKREQQALDDATVRAAESNARVEWSAPPPPENTPAPNPKPSPPRKTVTTPKPASAASPPDNGAKVTIETTASGWIIPVKTYVGKSGDTCRDMQQHAEKGGKKADQNITLCKTAEGWNIPQKTS